MSMEKVTPPEPARLRVVSNRQADVSLRSILGEEAPRRKRGFARALRWLVGALAVVAAGFAIWFYFDQGDAYTYTMQKIVRGDLTVVVTATGTVQPTAQVDVSTAISGIVRKVNVDFNSKVRLGDVLAELDTDTLKANVASAKARLIAAGANVAKAQAALDAAVAVYQRKEALFERGVASAQVLEDARLNVQANGAVVEAAKAEVLVAEADLQLVSTNLGWATIISPIDGVVLTRNVDEGSTVAASFQAPVLFSIAGDLREMEVQVDVDEADIGSVSVGQASTFTVDAYRGRSFPAEIKTIRFVSQTVNNVVTYKAILQVDNSDLLLRPGMTATADIVVKTVKSALLVPNAALRFTPPEDTGGGGFLSIFSPPDAVTQPEVPGGARSAWVMRDGVLTQVPVEVGATDGQKTELLSGDLKEGDEVVTDAVARD
jgi:HlyD family secretion protein